MTSFIIVRTMRQREDGNKALLESMIEHLNRRPRAEVGEDPVELDSYMERLWAFAETWLQAGYRLNDWSMRSILQKDIESMTNFLQRRPDGQPYLITVLGHL